MNKMLVAAAVLITLLISAIGIGYADERTDSLLCVEKDYRPRCEEKDTVIRETSDCTDNTCHEVLSDRVRVWYSKTDWRAFSRSNNGRLHHIPDLANGWTYEINFTCDAEHGFVVHDFIWGYDFYWKQKSYASIARSHEDGSVVIWGEETTVRKPLDRNWDIEPKFVGGIIKGSTYVEYFFEDLENYKQLSMEQIVEPSSTEKIIAHFNMRLALPEIQSLYDNCR